MVMMCLWRVSDERKFLLMSAVGIEFVRSGIADYVRREMYCSLEVSVV